MTTETTPRAVRGLAIVKPGQGKAARWTAYLLTGLVVALGVRSLYGAFNRPGEGVLVADLPVIGDLTIIKLICAFVFVLGIYVVHVILNRERTVDLLIDTEQELRKVSWPSGRDVRSATLVVTLVTVVMGALLFWADELLEVLLKFVYAS
jgi:preprotein translocase SecE subunit